MQLNVIKKDKNLLEVEVEGECVGFVNLVKEELWNDKDVDEVAHIKEHPYMDEPKLYVKTKRKQPKGVIKNAIERIKVRTKDFEKEFKRALKD